MKKPKGLGLIGVLLILAALILATGGVVVWWKKAGPVPSPRSSVELRPTVGKPVTPIPSPLPPPVSSRETMVTTSKNIYTRGENIKILIKNKGKGPIATTSHQSACSIVTLERKTSEGWQSEGVCTSEIQTFSVVIEAGEEKVGTISPIYAGKGPPHQDLPKGTYRVKFSFVTGRDPYTSQEDQVVYSSEFKLR